MVEGAAADGGQSGIAEAARMLHSRHRQPECLWETSDDPQRQASVVAPVDPVDYPFDP
jgi:hypothetical protein